MEQKILADYSYEELESLLTGAGFPKFRAGQVFSWLAKGIDLFSEQTNLPKMLLEYLQNEHFSAFGARILKEYQSSIDETRKFLLKLEDGNCIESVLMKYEHGNTVCISSQVGCRMGCVFCASTRGGLVRNLSAGEIFAQVALVNRAGGTISNIVIMGIGEPLDNYDNIVKFLHLVNDSRGINIGARHISLSTCGLVDQIDQLRQENLGITLCISLHAPNDQLRKKIMPVANRYQIADIIGACKRYFDTTGRRIIFEYSLIDGVNDTDEAAIELSNLLRGMCAHINLIGMNQIEESEFRRSRNIERFLNILLKKGLSATVRRELGRDISGSCGQLRARQTSMEPH